MSELSDLDDSYSDAIRLELSKIPKHSRKGFQVALHRAQVTQANQERKAEERRHIPITLPKLTFMGD